MAAGDGLLRHAVPTGLPGAWQLINDMSCKGFEGT
jgi:hypothetical protein